MRPRPLLTRLALALAGASALVAQHADAAPAGHRAYITWQKDQDQLFVTDGSGGHAHRVAGTVDPWAPALSPDGRWVAYSDFGTRGDVNMTLVISPTTGQGRRILDLGADWLTEPAWSPDGHELVFARQHALGADEEGIWPVAAGAFAYRCTIDVVDLRSGQLRTVGNAGGWSAAGTNAVGVGPAWAGASGACSANPAWSPRGDLIAFVAGGGVGVDAAYYEHAGREPLFTVHPDGTGLTLLSPSASGYGLDFSPDGSRLAYGFSPRSDGSDVQELHTIAVNGSDDRVVASLGNHSYVGYPAWAPSGRQILAEVDPAGSSSYLATVDLRSGRVSRATRPAGTLQYESPDWSR